MGGSEREAGARESSDPVFLTHVGGFAVYAWLVCYLMVRGITEEPLPIALYTLAMGLHFVGVDHSLLREHGAAYMRVGRFVLAIAALAGWSVAMVTELDRPPVVTAFGVISESPFMRPSSRPHPAKHSHYLIGMRWRFRWMVCRWKA